MKKMPELVSYRDDVFSRSFPTPQTVFTRQQQLKSAFQHEDTPSHPEHPLKNCSELVNVKVHTRFVSRAGGDVVSLSSGHLARGWSTLVATVTQAVRHLELGSCCCCNLNARPYYVDGCQSPSLASVTKITCDLIPLDLARIQASSTQARSVKSRDPEKSICLALVDGRFLTKARISSSESKTSAGNDKKDGWTAGWLAGRFPACS